MIESHFAMTEELKDLLQQFAQELPEIEQPPGLAAVAEYLVDCAAVKRTESFEAAFRLIEHHIIYASDELRHALIVELLENLKNFCTWRDMDYVIFENWLGPESHVAWRWLEKRWQGKESLAEATRKLTD